MSSPDFIRKFEWKGWVLPLVLLLAWTVWTNVHPSLLFPTPQKTVAAFQEYSSTGAIWHFIGTSLRRFSYGFLLGCVAGFLAGAALGSSIWLERFFLPNIQAFRQVPLVGWVPLLVLWFGLGDSPRVVLIAMGAFFPVLLNTWAGFRNVPRNYREVGAAFGLTRLQTLRRIVLPASLPWVRSGTILSLTFSWTILVASEILTETNGGLSDLLDLGRERFRLELVNVAIILLGGIGFLMNFGLERVWSIGRLRWLSQNIHNQSKRGQTT